MKFISEIAKRRARHVGHYWLHIEASRKQVGTYKIMFVLECNSLNLSSLIARRKPICERIESRTKCARRPLVPCYRPPAAPCGETARNSYRVFATTPCAAGAALGGPLQERNFLMLVSTVMCPKTAEAALTITW